MDNVQSSVLAPDGGDGEGQVVRHVAAIADRPQALRHDGYELTVNLRVAGREQRHLVAAAVQLLDERGNDPLRAGIADGRNGEHRRHGDAYAERFHGGPMLPPRTTDGHRVRPRPTCKLMRRACPTGAYRSQSSP